MVFARFLSSQRICVRQQKLARGRILLGTTSYMIWFNSSTQILTIPILRSDVPYSAQTVGVIFKTERDSFRVLDQNGQVRLVQPHQISMRRDSNRAVATDHDGHEIRINDNMKESEGEVRHYFLYFKHSLMVTPKGTERTRFAYLSILLCLPP